ncbi:HU family DNA-binding protein [Alicyclobacillus macrosporangiidus]|uniref:HU family DNA-binding protein n=1 Tax=Alicyclobacillus macrosporangiidus TaxID=392015 RepID=UPI0004973F5B|nr:HU family DNA-binding protein [Alicyclobacillus macrosporangiidus]
MTKTELIEELAVRAELPKAKAGRVIDTLCEVIGERLQAGEKVMLPPLGRFIHVHRSARKARNPLTGEKVDVPERVAVRFQASATLKRRLN